jgi:hypothetical protein
VPTESRKCWAAGVSPCRGKLSAEHVFTRGLSPTKEVEQFGHPRLPDGRLGSIDDFQIKNLCQGHNSDLTDVDQAAIDFMNVARETNVIAQVRLSKPSGDRGRIEYAVDGILFERWALKTTVSTSQLRAADWRWTPPPEFPALVLGKQALPVGCGLAALNGVRDDFGAYNGISCTYYRSTADGDVVASLIGFGGFLFICSWSVPVADLVPIRSRTFTAESAELHPRSIEIPGTNIWTRFEWSGTPVDDSEVQKLRAKYASPPR